MATWNTQGKPGVGAGFGWEYNRANLTYDAVTDPTSGLSVKYNGLGQGQVWSNQAES